MGMFRRRLKCMVPDSVRLSARVWTTDAVRPWAVHRLRGLARKRPVRLHLGSGFVRKPGWINIDLFGPPIDIPLNFLRGVPLPDESVDAIASEHVFEHLGLAEGLRLLDECRRLLRPGGAVRVGVPDGGALLDSYSGSGDNPGWANAAPTPMLAVQQLFYEHGHRSMYDERTLLLAFTTAGFAAVTRSEPGGGYLGPLADTPSRASGSLYVEGVKELGGSSGGPVEAAAERDGLAPRMSSWAPSKTSPTAAPAPTSLQQEGPASRPPASLRLVS